MSKLRLSHDHHYVPRCYLRGFCRSDGTFDVYDKTYRKFKKAPQSPGTVFFERRRNTVVLHGQNTDKIETAFARIESGIGRLFDLITSGVSSENLLTPEGIHLLKRHMAIQFWRLPQYDDVSREYLMAMTPEQLETMCHSFTSAKLPIQEVHDLIQVDPGFRHHFRSFWLPLGTFDAKNSVPDDMEWRVLDVADAKSWANNLCGDSPFVIQNLARFFTFRTSFIFPLSKSRLLVARPSTTLVSRFSPLLSTKISMLTYLHANRYVATPSKAYLEKIISFSDSYRGDLGELRLKDEVFGLLNSTP